jgi:hypothetical protein
MSKTIRIQGIGIMNAKTASELCPGDVTVWNFGYCHPVVSVAPMTARFLAVTLRTENGREYVRKMRDNRLVAVESR